MHTHSSKSFQPNETDPIEFDFSALCYLISIGKEAIEPTITALQNPKYQFTTMRALDANALDMELIYRQCLPAACIGAKLELPAGDISRYLYMFATCQTLILNHIDRHLDLSGSHTLRDPALLLTDVRATMCYAIAQLYAGMQINSSCGNELAALREMSAVSALIIQSMYDNYATRFSAKLLHIPDLVLSAYRDPVRSRHLGSGFYASSIRGLYAFFRITIPDSLDIMLLGMRRLRQRVDELCDLFEDTATGLISYPVALLLADSKYHSHTTGLVTTMWERSKMIIGAYVHDAGKASLALRTDTELQHTHAALLTMLEQSGVLSRCYAEASDLWLNIRDHASLALPGPVADIIRVVVDLKRALLERIARSHWDDRIERTFSDILARSTGTKHD